ncbi:polyamine aminopropyltransferase [Puniceicoccaceae bacterium K14]|nr:polyamine aminopropyltransferase [Puniceicoccaceae bacterium K14]
MFNSITKAPSDPSLSPKETSQRSYHTYIIVLVTFLMGGCGMAYEYTLSKIASDILGNSVQQWAIVIAVMLSCMGFGAEIQRHISDKRLVDALVYSQILLALLGGYGSLLMLHIFSALPSHFVLIQYILVSSIGTLIGFEIPLLTRINEQFSADVKNNLARILKMDYLGALIGALLWVFLLFRYFSMVETGLILALTTLASALLLLFAFRSQTKQLTRLYSGIAIATGVICLGFLFSKQWTLTAEQRLYRDKIVFQETSKYQHIVITESHAGVLSCFINGHLQFNSHDEHIYHENLVHPAMHIAPRRDSVLILGGGDGLALREVLKYEDVNEVTLVDLDPAMTDLAKNNPLFQRLNQNSLSSTKTTITPNAALVETGNATLNVSKATDFAGDQSDTIATISVFNLDAAAFVAQAPGKYDVIIIDFPDPNSVELAKLYSQHFYGFVRQKLSAHGIFVQQSTSPYHAKEAYLCIGRTIQSAGLNALPYHDNVPSFGEWGWWIGCRDDAKSQAKLKDSLLQIDSLTPPTRYLTPNLIHSSLHFGKDQLMTDQQDVNTITNPCIYTHYLEAWKNTKGIL